MEKGHYGKYTGNARHSKHHMVNSWEEEDVKRGRKEMEEGHKGHAEALFDDAHGSYNWDGHNSTGAEHAPSRKSRSERLRKRAMNRSERKGAEWGDYDYEDPRVQKMLEKANELEARTGEGKRQLAGGSFAEEAPESGYIYSKAAGQLAPLAPGKWGDGEQAQEAAQRYTNRFASSGYNDAYEEMMQEKAAAFADAAPSLIPIAAPAAAGQHELLHKAISGEQAQEASQHEAQEDSPLNNSCNCQ